MVSGAGRGGVASHSQKTAPLYLAPSMHQCLFQSGPPLVLSLGKQIRENYGFDEGAPRLTRTRCTRQSFDAF